MDETRVVHSKYEKTGESVNTVRFARRHALYMDLFTKHDVKNETQSGSKQIRVLLADDHPAVRQGLTTILDSQKDIKIVAEAADGEEACKLYDQLSPDVLMLDLRMPKKDGLQVLIELMSRRVSKARIS